MDNAFPPPPAYKNLSLYYIGIWAAYFILSTIYIFPKGLPQPADIILLAGLAPGLVWQFMQSGGRISTLYITGSAFAALTVIINLTQFAFMYDQRFLLSALYYPFNMLVFCYVVFLFRQNPAHLSRVTYGALAIAIVTQLVWALFFDDGWRATGGFQNPNQLAYWALLSAGILYFLRRNDRFRWRDIALFMMLFAIQGLSLSKAGIICSGVLYLALLLSNKTSAAVKLTMIGAALLGLVASLMSASGIEAITPNQNIVQNMIDRLATIGLEHDDSLVGRGYDRMWRYPEYLLLGAGEGGFDRFTSVGKMRELHSGLATILFSYGTLGFALFSAFIVMVFNKQPMMAWVVLGCILLFSLPHQAFRFTYFWVFLGIAYGSFMSLQLTPQLRKIP